MRSREIQVLRQSRLALAKRVDEYKMNAGCCVCGNKNPIVLLFHHTGDEKKEFTIGVAVNKGMPWEKIEAEIKKCIVVCANDHLIIHYQLRHA